VAIIGGLVSSTALTLLVVPVVYSLLDPVSEFIRRRVKSEGSGGMKEKVTEEKEEDKEREGVLV